jgi:Gpi18-like mannosyltransferase
VNTVGDAPARVILKPREVYEVGAILLGGIFVRLLIVLVSRGTNDIVSWEAFGTQIAEHGLTWMYGNVPLWNHPPLMGYMAEGLGALAPVLGWAFPPTFKLVPIAADGLSAVLIFRVWLTRSGDYRTARRALLLFVFSLNAILVSGYHGNTDPLAGALVLAACLAVERGRHFVGGALLAAAVNVKLIPLLLVPLLAARSAPRDVGRFAAGAALGMLPFLPVM